MQAAGGLVEPEVSTTDSRRFETVARETMSHHYGVALNSASVPGVAKRFDLVSADGQIVGDAKGFTLVGRGRLPPAKLSVIAESVWLLEKTLAQHCFLVFGNDIRVPQMWLEKYGRLVACVDFFFLGDDGERRRIHRS